ncbi:MAG: type II toxin-antitoxin system death-on-curing family toxin [Paludibacteraceae bacterium]|nr:type II toxin-antitoxin system death-on-curing family toxin [Paludibacteraceae bacterium]
MIDLYDAIRIHEILIDRFGGSKGIRDINLLESALSRPFQTFDKKDLHPYPVDKAAALIESMLINHPFIDGNKRTRYVLMRLLLMDYGFDIHATEDEKYDFVITVAKDDLKFEDIVKWIKDKTATGDNML